MNFKTPVRKRLALAGAIVTLGLFGAACSATLVLPAGGRVGITVGTSAATPAPTTTHTVVTNVTSTDLQSDYIKVVQTTGPSVVQIQTSGGLGSGIVFDSKGDIVTNAHVVSGSSTFTVTTSTGATLAATLVGVDTSHDLAVIRVNSTSLTPATFTDSSALQVGDIVLAIGSPYGLSGSVTQGLVSALNRDIPESRSVTLTGLIQTSAAINPGNSGGALTNLAGQVVGIPTLGASGGDGIGFAIPSNTVVSVANRLIGGL